MTCGAGPLAQAEDSRTTVDLRPEFERLHLTPRAQGKRPTCSVFAVTQALEFAVSRQQPQTGRLSAEYLIWAANQERPESRDGGFFSELWGGFAKHGITTEQRMPYRSAFDPALTPGTRASKDAALRLALGLREHWIKKWNVNTGLSDAELETVRSTLRSGWPVCGGFRWPKNHAWENGVVRMCPPDEVFDGHSVLLVGYRDDPGAPGRGVFLIRDSGSGEDRAMPYTYTRAYMNDAVWFGPDDKAR